MPRNKEALIRYRVINRCIRDYTYVSKEQLINACERALDISPIGERTIEGDIHAMRYDNALGYDAPIKFDRNRKAYYYDPPDYSIDNIPLNDDELQSLTFAATLLDQFKNVEIFSKFTGSVQKIVDAVNINRVMDDKGTLYFIDFEKVPFVKGSEFLDPIIKAIRQKQVLKITYHAFHSEKDHHHDIHPYLLKEYRNRWYLIGFHEYFREIRIYGLDRIVSLDVNPNLNYIDSNFSPEDYFKNVIGIFSPLGEPPEIILEFNKETAQYIITQPIHESQKMIGENDNSITFSLMVHPTVELLQMILGWGNAIKVMKPEYLKEEISSILRENLDRYN
jgi:predicted DNA-binding transcriptional regulator YafY